MAYNFLDPSKVIDSAFSISHEPINGLCVKGQINKAQEFLDDTVSRSA